MLLLLLLQGVEGEFFDLLEKLHLKLAEINTLSFDLCCRRNLGQVLLFGDLANNGKQQFLAANVLPKTPTNTIPGTVVSRATIAEKEEDGKWLEIFHCDEHLKNNKGYLALTPLESVSSWRLQFEQDPDKGLELYLTPVKIGTTQHVLPIGIRWNVATRRYQSLDQSYQHFLNEGPALEDPRSVLR